MARCLFILLLTTTGCPFVSSMSLHIQGFIPGRNPVQSLLYVRPAACMAIDDINSKAILPKYNLTMNISDTKVTLAPYIMIFVNRTWPEFFNALISEFFNAFISECFIAFI